MLRRKDVSARSEGIVQTVIDQGSTAAGFAIIFISQARASGGTPEPQNTHVWDGLEGRADP